MITAIVYIGIFVFGVLVGMFVACLLAAGNGGWEK